MRPMAIRPRDIKTVLGLACTGHGASAAFVDRSGQVRATVLERWTGVKHMLLFGAEEREAIQNPTNALDEEIRGVLSHTAGGFPPNRLFEETIDDWMNWFLSDVGMTLEDIDLLVCSPSHFATCFWRLGKHLDRWFPRAIVHNKIEHHAVHQRQAFWQSGFDDCVVLTLDSCGESLERLDGRKLAGTISTLRSDGEYNLLKEFYFPECSAGMYYDIACQHLAFRQGQEGKTMGLAPFGRSTLADKLLTHLELHDDGGFGFMAPNEFEAALHEYASPRERDGEILREHEDVAYAAQALTERVVTNAFRAALRLSGKRKLAYAGGLALNSVANEIARRAAEPDELYIAPSPGDPGHALGCALFGGYELAMFQPPTTALPEYLGPRYSPAQVQAALELANEHFVTRPDALAEVVARLLSNHYIIARFSGGAEYGPRALGNRSILCDPRPPGMKDYLNKRVKHREPFRPFAPVVLEHRARDWFDVSTPTPFMLRVVPILERVRSRIPAVSHVDGTARLQTLNRDQNPGLFDIIEAFERLTGLPIILNTSFNMGGKPIVEQPADALEAFITSKIDVLVLEDWLVTKRPLAECLAQVQPIGDS